MALRKNRLVIKIGTSSLMNETGNTDLRNIEKIVRVIADIRGMGYEIIIVSSGAIALGTKKLGLGSIPDDIKDKLACAAVGQCLLLHLYDKLFEEYSCTIAQVLMAGSDADDEETRSNLISTFDTLISMGVIPIVNENDSVTSKEIESGSGSGVTVFGDNDMLSAIVTKLTKSGRLIILSDSADLLGKGSRRGGGGVATKKAAAEFAAAEGADASVIDCKNPELLYDIIEEKQTGTFFPGQK